MLGFIEHLELKGNKLATIERYMLAIRTLGTDGKPYEELQRQDLLDWMRLLPRARFDNGDGSELAANTIEATKCMVKSFLRWIHNGGTRDRELPEAIKCIHYKQPKRDLRLEILTREEIRKLLAACERQRDRALVFVGYESGARAGELLSLRLRDVEFDQYGAIVMVNGKTGPRRIRLVESIPDLLEWLNQHPYKDEPNAPLWISRNGERQPIRGEWFHSLLQQLARRAGIRKHVHPHLFRHSRATHLANVLTEAQMREYFGWTKRSEVPSIYVHLSGRDVDATLLKHYGVVKEEARREEEILSSWRCPRCGLENSAGMRFCGRCGMALNVHDAERAAKAIEHAEHTQELLASWLTKHAPRILQRALEDPEIRKEIELAMRGA